MARVSTIRSRRVPVAVRVDEPVEALAELGSGRPGDRRGDARAIGLGVKHVRAAQRVPAGAIPTSTTGSRNDAASMIPDEELPTIAAARLMSVK